MAYGQRNYNQIQGRVSPSGLPPIYRINQIGCFLTAFCNLTERFGKAKTPIELNAIFRDRGIYIDVDDKIFDDLAWSSITKYDPNIVVSGTGLGAPSNNNAIVKFTGLSNNWGTHFCLVADAKKGLIVDSWDGKVKHWSAYNNPDAWATYVDRTPKPASQPQPEPVTVPPQHIQVQKGWGISHAAKAYGYKDFASEARWNLIARLNGHPDYRAFRLSPGQVIRMEGAAQQPAPTPAPQPSVPSVIDVTARPGEGISYLLKRAGYSKEAYSSQSEWARFSQLNGAPEGSFIKIKAGQSYKVYPQPAAPPKPVPVEKVEAPQPVTEPKPVEVTATLGVVDVETETERTEPIAPDNYVGPLQDDDDDELNDLSAAKEARMLAGNAIGYDFRERIVDIIARIGAFFVKFVNKLKIKK